MSCDYAIGKCNGCGEPLSSIWDEPYCNIGCKPKPKNIIITPGEFDKFVEYTFAEEMDKARNADS